MLLNTKRHKVTLVLSIIISAILSIPVLAFIYMKAVTLLPGLQSRIVSAVVTLVFFLLMYAFLMRKYRKRKKLLKEPFPDQWNIYLLENIPFYASLGGSEREKFSKYVQVFLGEHLITGIDTDVDDDIRLMVAASAIIPIFNFPQWEYDKLGEILIYPQNFNEEFSFDQGNAGTLGMVIENGSAMILSKPALIDGFRKVNDGSNVGIHEFIHKIDEEDGDIDGIPAILMDKETAAAWVEIMDREMEAIENGESDINPYGLTNRAEFFSVACEYFFENPSRMEENHPELYRVMSKMFKQDMASLLSTALSSMIKRKNKIGRNDPCPCGSGRKYKKCCLNRKR